MQAARPSFHSAVCKPARLAEGLLRRPGDPKQCLPQVGLAPGLIWPVVILGSKLVRNSHWVKLAAAPQGLEAPSRPRLSSKRGAGSCEPRGPSVACATWV